MTLTDPVLKNHMSVAVTCIPCVIINIFQPIKNDFFAIASMHTFIDYFNITRKSWEPLLDPPLKCNVMYETSSDRGKGASFVSNAICDVNLASALVEFIDEIKESFIASFQTSFFGSNATSTITVANNATNHSHGVHISTLSQTHSKFYRKWH